MTSKFILPLAGRHAELRSNLASILQIEPGQITDKFETYKWIYIPMEPQNKSLIDVILVTLYLSNCLELTELENQQTIDALDQLTLKYPESNKMLFTDIPNQYRNLPIVYPDILLSESSPTKGAHTDVLSGGPPSPYQQCQTLTQEMAAVEQGTPFKSKDLHSPKCRATPQKGSSTFLPQETGPIPSILSPGIGSSQETGHIMSTQPYPFPPQDQDIFFGLSRSHTTGIDENSTVRDNLYSEDKDLQTQMVNAILSGMNYPIKLHFHHRLNAHGTWRAFPGNITVGMLMPDSPHFSKCVPYVTLAMGYELGAQTFRDAGVSKQEIDSLSHLIGKIDAKMEKIEDTLANLSLISHKRSGHGDADRDTIKAKLDVLETAMDNMKVLYQGPGKRKAVEVPGESSKTSGKYQPTSISQLARLSNDSSSDEDSDARASISSLKKDESNSTDSSDEGKYKKKKQPIQRKKPQVKGVRVIHSLSEF